MKFKIATLLTLSSLASTMAAHANEVDLSANQSMKITFRIAHKNLNNQPVFGEVQSMTLDKNVTIPVSLDQFDRAGIMILSVDGRELPLSANEFDKPERCSMTTDKTKTSGIIKLNLLPHAINCESHGGIFG